MQGGLSLVFISTQCRYSIRPKGSNRLARCELEAGFEWSKNGPRVGLGTRIRGSTDTGPTLDRSKTT